MKNRTTPEVIIELKPNEIFVFGSNLAGRHGAGAAKQALKLGAEYGKGFGLVGKTFAIPTKDSNIQTLPLIDIMYWVHYFCEFSKHNNYTFLVTKIGCGLAGYEPKDIAPFFSSIIDIPNIHLPAEFWEVLNKI